MTETYDRKPTRAMQRRLRMVHAQQPGALDVRAIRLAPKRYGDTQESFAAMVGVPLKTLRNWEQARRAPTGPARILLAMIQKNHRIVVETSGSVSNFPPS
jgi:putative transcriptional regulator